MSNVGGGLRSIRRGRLLAPWVCGCSIALARPVLAEPHTEPRVPSQAPAPAPVEPRWYGWQTLLTDGAGVASLLAAAAASRNDTVVALGVGTGLTALALGAPAVHLAHRRVGAAFTSLGMRLAVPALAALALSRPCRSECSEQMLVLLLIPAPIAIDAAALAWETPKPRSTASSLLVLPGVLPNRSLVLGISGGF